MIARGAFPHPWIGISGTNLTAQIREELGFAQDRSGILIVAVLDGGPASKSGLLGYEDGLGDLIIGVDGVQLRDFEDLLTYISSETVVGQTIDLSVLRQSEEILVPVELEERPGSER